MVAFSSFAAQRALFSARLPSLSVASRAPPLPMPHSPLRQLTYHVANSPTTPPSELPLRLWRHPPPPPPPHSPRRSPPRPPTAHLLAHPPPRHACHLTRRQAHRSAYTALQKTRGPSIIKGMKRAGCGPGSLGQDVCDLVAEFAGSWRTEWRVSHPLPSPHSVERVENAGECRFEAFLSDLVERALVWRPSPIWMLAPAERSAAASPSWICAVVRDFPLLVAGISAPLPMFLNRIFDSKSVAVVIMRPADRRAVICAQGGPVWKHFLSGDDGWEELSPDAATARASSVFEWRAQIARQHCLEDSVAADDVQGGIDISWVSRLAPSAALTQASRDFKVQRPRSGEMTS